MRPARAPPNLHVHIPSPRPRSLPSAAPCPLPIGRCCLPVSAKAGQKPGGAAWRCRGSGHSLRGLRADSTRRLPIARPASQWQRGAIRSVPSITRGHTRAALSRRYRQAGSMKMHSRPAKESQSGRGHSSGRPCLRGQRSSGGAALSVSPRLSVRAWALSTATKGSPNPLHV